MLTQLKRLNADYALRYTTFVSCIFFALLCVFTIVAFNMGWLLFALFTGLSVMGFYDLKQTKKSILRNYPVIGHFRYLFEYIRPEMRQYFVESDVEATPFSRSQRISEGEIRLLANVVPRVKARSLLDENISDDHKVYKNYWHKVSADSFLLQI